MSHTKLTEKSVTKFQSPIEHRSWDRIGRDGRRLLVMLDYCTSENRLIYVMEI